MTGTADLKSLGHCPLWIKPGIIFVVFQQDPRTMKRIVLPLALLFSFSSLAQDRTADSTGLPGDDFSLERALDLFQRNIEMEKFEEELNTDSTRVNNLDLDGNGETDYVRVETRREENAVYVVMKVATSATESQDVAVIGIEKTGEESATLQIIGDEDLYGPNVFVEPYEEKADAAPSKGPRSPELVGVRVAVNVWIWRPIPWCFSPRFYAYASPWYWGHYPGWWRPWHPHPWRAWWGWRHHHHGWYRPWNSCRVGRAQALYAPRRARSAAVHARYPGMRHPRIDKVPAGGGQVKPGKKLAPNQGQPTKTAPAKVKPQRKAPPKGTRPATKPSKGKGAPRPPKKGK